MSDKPPAIPTKLVHRAVRTSDLPSDSRHIMHVLALIADYQTSELPPRFTPSTRQLARETGCSESTVIRRRKELEKAGWIVLKRPTAAQAARHEPIRYFLAIPAVGAHRDHAEAAARLVQGLTETADLDQTFPEIPTPIAADNLPGFTVHPPGMAPWTPAGVSESYPETPTGMSDSYPGEVSGSYPEMPSGVSDSYPAGCQPDTPKNTYQEHYQEPEKPPAGAGGREERFVIAEELVDKFWHIHGSRYAQRRPAVRAVILTAVADNGVDRDDAAKALDALARAGQQITPDSLTKALARIRGHDPARAAEPPPPRPPRRFCQIRDHAAVELTEHGLCPNCAADARATPDDLDEPQARPSHIPPPRRSHHDPLIDDTQLIPNRETA